MKSKLCTYIVYIQIISIANAENILMNYFENLEKKYQDCCENQAVSNHDALNPSVYRLSIFLVPVVKRSAIGLARLGTVNGKTIFG